MNAQLQGPGESGPRWKPVGDPTEVALVTLAIKGRVVPYKLRARWPRQAEIPFDPDAKLMATQHPTGGRPRVIIKGAPEVLLGMCRVSRRGDEDVALDWVEELRELIVRAQDRRRLALGAGGDR